METDGSVVYNNDWLSNATERDEQFIDIGVMTGSIKNHAAQLVNDESGLTPTNARSLLGNTQKHKRDPSESSLVDQLSIVYNWVEWMQDS